MFTKEEIKKFIISVVTLVCTLLIVAFISLIIFILKLGKAQSETEHTNFVIATTQTMYSDTKT
jgi:hypothetical protein